MHFDEEDLETRASLCEETREGLKFFKEQGEFVEFLGDMFYIGEDADSLKDLGFILEEADFETTASLTTRRNVGTTPIASNPYKEGFDAPDFKSIKTDGARVLDFEDGYMPDSSEIILNRIVSPSEGYEDSRPSHVIYDRDTKAYYCIRNGCQDCHVEAVKAPAEYQVVSADISAQEPMASTLVTREPKWQEVFELKNLKYDETLLQYMDMIAEEYLRIPKREPAYVLFLHNTYYYDRTELYQLNYLVHEVKNGQPKREELKTFILYLIDKFEEYRKSLIKKD